MKQCTRTIHLNSFFSLSEAATVVATAFTKTESLGANYWEIDQALPFTTFTTQLGINEKISYVVKEKSTNKIAHVLLILIILLQYNTTGH